MEYILLSFLVVLFGFIIYQDVKFRHIHITLPILIFILTMYMNVALISSVDIIKSSGFLLINFMCIVVYFSMKKSTLINPFKNLIGLGDLIFLIGVIPMFSFRNYILFFITGMLFTLLLYAVFYKRYTQKAIPLAGYLSIYAVLLLISDFLIPINIFHGFIF